MALPGAITLAVTGQWRLAFGAATALMVGFLTIAVGQNIGPLLFRFLMTGQGVTLAVTCFTAIALIAGAFRTQTQD